MDPDTRQRSRARRGTLLAVAAAMLTLPAVAPAAGVVKPRVTTGGARHVLPSSAQITGTVNPEGIPTDYHFEWGTTTAYGNQTPFAHAGAGTARVKVGQSISPLLPGVVYHFRIVAVYGNHEMVAGPDHAFTSKSTALKFTLVKLPAITVGAPFILSGTLTGSGAAHHGVALQATTFPYTRPFTNIGLPGLTDALGRFSFRVNNLLTSTDFRVVTIDSRPVYSGIETIHAALKITLHAKRTRHVGVYKLYGTVTPASSGAAVLFQLRKVAPPGSKLREKAEEEEETAYVFGTQFATTVKKGGHTFSRFSTTMHVHRAGVYRAYVKPRRGGAYVAGASATLRLRAVPARKRTARRHRTTAKAKH